MQIIDIKETEWKFSHAESTSIISISQSNIFLENQINKKELHLLLPINLD